MRVDLGNLTEITKKSAAVQNKGTQAVLNENITTKETDKTGHSYTVKSVTYETLLAEDKKSAEDIAMQADAVDPQAMHDEMAVLANTTTEEDYEKMEEDGYSVNDTEIPEIVTEMDKIKIQLAKAGVDIRIFGDDVSVEKIAEVLGSAGVGQIEAALRMADLPATEQNVSETEEALEMAENLEPLSDGAKKYILDNGLDATIDNLYKAEYSAGGTGESYSVPSTEENTDFSQLDEQIQKMLQDTGFEITDENIEDSRWLLENEIPLTAENLESYQSLKDLRLPQDNEVVLKAITDAIAQGKRPKDAVLAITRQRQLEEVRLEMSAKAKSKLTPEQRKATLRRVLEKIRPYGFFVVCSLIVAAVSVAAQLYIPILCGSAIDMMLGKGNVDFNGVLRIVVEIVIVAVVAAFAQWLLSVCNNRITFSVSRDLRNAALRKIQTLPLSYLDSHPSGDIVSRMVADVDTFADGLLMGFTQLFSGVLTIFGTLLFMLSENVPITLVVVCITPLSLVVASFLAKRSYKYFQGQSTVRGEQTALVNEMIEGQKVVQAFGHEAESLAAFDEVNGRLQSVSLKAIFFSSMTNPATRFVNNIVYAGVGLVGAVYAVAGGITIGQLSIFLNYANQYTKPFNEISGVVTELQNALACAARVFELLDAEDQVPEAENAKVLETDGHVELKDVSFRYLPDRPLIEGLDLDVKPGQRIAIVGPTGCGKTTLINLLMRFYDVNGGSIKVSGTDIRDVTRASLRGSYGMVLQETWLRAGTVRENIAYGKPDATEEEIVAAAKAAHADSFIRRLPKGYDTIIAEDGGNISQGQKQLLCIARVMLCLPPMLILDEATSSIDTRTEVRIQAAFARMMQGRTSFIVAHRLSTIREADVILVMKDGHIVEQGDHDTLLAQGGFYAKLYNSQFEGVET